MGVKFKGGRTPRRQAAKKFKGEIIASREDRKGAQRQPNSKAGYARKDAKPQRKPKLKNSSGFELALPCRRDIPVPMGVKFKGGRTPRRQAAKKFKGEIIASREDRKGTQRKPNSKTGSARKDAKPQRKPKPKNSSGFEFLRVLAP